MTTERHRVESYGFGGYDESKPDNNRIDVQEFDVEVPDPIPVPAVVLVDEDGNEHRVTVDAGGELHTSKEPPRERGEKGDEVPGRREGGHVRPATAP